jgi:hypothetical protein
MEHVPWEMIFRFVTWIIEFIYGIFQKAPKKETAKALVAKGFSKLSGKDFVGFAPAPACEACKDKK